MAKLNIETTYFSELWKMENRHGLDNTGVYVHAFHTGDIMIK
jgi:hypothetical protein